MLQNGMRYEGRVVESSHALAHASAGHFSGPFEASTIVSLHESVDGTVGAIAEGRGGEVHVHRVIPGDVGFGAFARALGRVVGVPSNTTFAVWDALAENGTPRFLEAFRGQLVEISEDGSFRVVLHDEAELREVLGVRRASAEPRGGELLRDVAW